MNTIEVTVTGAAGVSVDEVRDRVPELVEELRERLDGCGDGLTLPGYAPGERNSTAFQVMGAQLRAIHAYQREHGRPARATIECAGEDAARLYKQIYNFYISTTKDARLEDKSWD